MKKGDLIVLVFIVLTAFGAIAYFFLTKPDPEAQIAKISLYGTVQKTIRLDEVSIPYDFTIDNDKGGYNVIHVEPGRIAVSEANCPDKLCIKRGYVTSRAAPAVCIPNGVVIEVDSDDPNELDAVSE